MANWNTIPGNTSVTPGQTVWRKLDDSGWEGHTIPTSKSDVGLGNVDNTSDANKPISTLTQAALDDKQATIPLGTVDQYFRGDETWDTLDKVAVGLPNVDDTSDADKPISDATQTALDEKVDSADLADVAISGAYADLSGEPTIPTLTSQLTNDSGFLTSAPVTSVAGKTGVVSLVKGDVGLGNVDNTSDANKPISTATQTALNGKYANPAGSTAQYVRGDGSLATFPSVGTGTVTSIGLSSSDFSISGSPITTSGSIIANLNTSGVTAGTYSGVTVTNKGIVTAATTRSYSSASRSLNTAFQISATRDTLASYSVDISTSVSLTGGAVGTVYLEYADNSGFSAGVTEVGRFVNGNTGTLVVGLTLNQTNTAPVSGIIPAGKYVRLRTDNTTGTPTFTYRSGQEVLL